MKQPPNERRELIDGRAYLKLSSNITVKRIAQIAGTTESEVLRLIKLAEDDDAKK